MKKQLLTIIFIWVMSISQAQIHEVGVFVGGTNYVGDIGNTNYISPNKLAGGIIYKRNINTRIALRGTLSYMPIEANDADATNSFRKNRNFKFKNDIIELAVGIEYNFFEYDVESSDKTFTPYILLELAGFVYRSTALKKIESDDLLTLFTAFAPKNKVSYSTAIPFGFGFKIKLLSNITFAIETKARYTFKDDLDSTPFIDNLDRPFTDSRKLKNIYYVDEGDIKKFDKFKDKISGNGNDWYMFTGFSFVYTFRETYRKPIWYK